MIVINTDNFETEVIKSEQPVVMDLWDLGGPCLALMPGVEPLAGEYEGKIKFGKVNVMENRRLVSLWRLWECRHFCFIAGAGSRNALRANR